MSAQDGPQASEIRKQQEDGPQRASKASARGQTPAQLAANAVLGIRQKVQGLAHNQTVAAQFIRTHQIGKRLRRLLIDVSWLMDPHEAMAQGPLQWLACWVFESGSAFEAGRGLFKHVGAVSRYVNNTPNSEWVRDLTTDGDVEANPGPISAPRSMEELKTAASSRMEWIEGASTSSWCDTESARVYLEECSAASTCNEFGVNSSVCFNYGWFPASSSSHYKGRTQPWTTQYYMSTINEAVTQVTRSTVEGLIDEASEGVPLCVGVGIDRPLPEAQALYYFIERCGERAVKVVTSTKTGLFWKLRDGEEQSPLSTTGVTSTVIFTKWHLEAGQGTFAVLTPFCAVFDKTDQHVGWMVNGVQHDLGVFEPAEGTLPKDLKGKAPMPHSDLKSTLVGYYASVKGNGIQAALLPRSWGPPVIGVTPLDGGVGVSALVPTDLLNRTVSTGVLNRRAVPAEEHDDYWPEAAIGAGPDVLLIARVALRAQPTTMVLPFLKLGLMHRWASFADRDASRRIVLTGQSEVHEPNTTMVRQDQVRRLVNASGLALEDCGGTVNPAYPFMAEHERGRIAFFADPQLAVSEGGGVPLFIPWGIVSLEDMAVVAAYIMLFAPWPCGNLSLGINTTASKEAPPQCQLFSWYGTTLALPGETRLNVVLPRYMPAELCPSSKWAVPIQPTMGPLAVRDRAPYAPLPVIYTLDDGVPSVPLVDFCLSWIGGIATYRLSYLARLLQDAGLSDGSERWALDGLSVFSNHSGIMATGAVNPRETAAEPITMSQPPVTAEDDPVPLLMRCWRDVGDRLAHIPAEADWTNWVPQPDWCLPLPNMHSVGLVAMGLYKFKNETKEMELCKLLNYLYLSAALFAAGERRFIAWKQVHAEAAMSYESYQQAVAGRSSSEWHMYTSLFGISPFEPGKLKPLVVGAQQAVHGAKVLSVGPGIPYTDFLRSPTRWESNTWDLTAAQPLSKILPGCMPDLNMYTWCRSLPCEDMPFVVSTLVEGGTRPLNPVTGNFHAPPANFDGPLLLLKNSTRILPLNDMARPTPADVFMNRLMHFMPDYRLSDYSSGAAAQGAPEAGQAPVPLTRRTDAWGIAGGIDQVEIQATYPNVSTTWMPWTDAHTRRILALLAPRHGTVWMDLVHAGFGCLASGVVFTDQAPLTSWFGPIDDMGEGLKAIL